MNDVSRPKDGKRLVLFNAELVAFLASVVLSFVLFMGFSYRATLLKSLGVPFREHDFGPTNLLLRGLYLMRDTEIFFATAAALGLLLYLYIRTNAEQPLFHFGAMALMFVAATWGASQIGTWKAREHARLITTENYGTLAYCALNPDASIDAEAKEIFVKLTGESRLKMIAESDAFLHFAVLTENAPEKLRGQSIAVHKTDLSYCRFIGR